MFFLASLCFSADFAVTKTIPKIVHDSIEHFPFGVIDSTQTRAETISFALSSGIVQLPNPDRWTLFTAEEQTKGKGQHNRMWASPPDVNIYATYLLPWSQSKEALLFHLPQVVTISVAQTLEKFGFSPKIKWINDVTVNRKKICGVLCSSESLPGGQLRMVLTGIGLNVNMDAATADSLDQPVTSMAIEKGSNFDKSAVLQDLSERLHTNLMLLQKNGFSPFLDYVRSHMDYIGEKVEMFSNNENIKGVFEELTDHGTMRLRLEDGSIKNLCEGRMIIKK